MNTASHIASLPKQKKAPLDRLEEYLGNRACIARKSGFNAVAKDFDEQLAAFAKLKQLIPPLCSYALGAPTNKASENARDSLVNAAREMLGY